MSAEVEVRVTGRGSLRGGKPSAEAGVEARCDLCGKQADAVASVGAAGAAPFACKSCLRERLEQITVALWTFRDEQGQGLPWGKISG